MKKKQTKAEIEEARLCVSIDAEIRSATRQRMAHETLLKLIECRQGWGHEALVRNAIELTDLLLEELDGTAGY